MKIPSRSPDRLNTCLFAAVFAFSSIAIFYSLLRWIQAWFFIEPDPRIFVQTSRIPMFWRLLVSLYLGTFVFIGIAALHQRHSRWLYRQLPTVLVATLVVSVIQNLIAP